MSSTQRDWQRLNAYVDGELDPGTRAEVAAEVADRPDLATQVATLTRLKAAVDETIEPIGWSDVESRRARRPRASWRLIAAATAALVVVLSIAAVTIPWRGDTPPAWLAVPIAEHDAWVASGESHFADSGAGAALVGFATLGAGVELPDLSAGKLTIVGARFVAAAGGRPPALHVAYGGTRGCRVTLWITLASADLGGTLTRYAADPYRVYSWRVGDLAYALVSSVDPTRFDVIARAAHKVTLERATPDAETVTALQRSRAESPPCPT